MIKTRFTAIFVAVLAIVACDNKTDDKTTSTQIIVPDLATHHGEVKPWTSLETRDGSDRFHFAIMTDRTAAYRQGIFEQGVEKTNLLEPAFVMSVGDGIEGYTEDIDKLNRQWTEFSSFTHKLNAPYFYTVGNHDMANAVMQQDWDERLGAEYYHFIYKDVLFLVLNSEIFPGAAVDGRTFAKPEDQAAQMAYAQAVLETNPDVRWTFIFIHQPFWQASRYQQPNPDWLQIDQWIGDRPHSIFAGHLHGYNYEQHQGHDRITLATTGGNSRLRGVEYGEFDQIAWVTMTEEGPVVANLTLDGVLSKRIPVKEFAALRDQLHGAVSIELAAQENPIFGGGIQRITLQNPMEKPISISANLPASPNLSVSTSQIFRTLAPGEEEIIDIVLSVTAPTPMTELAPIRSEWRIAIDEDDGSSYATTKKMAIIPKYVFPIPATQNVVNIDGHLDEWGLDPLRISAETPAAIDGRGQYNGLTDHAVRFDIRYDDTFVYFAIDVVDDKLFFSPDMAPTTQDGILAMIDFRPEEERNGNRSLSEEMRGDFFGRGILALMAPSPIAGELRTGYLEQTLPPGTIFDAQRNDHGMSAEIAIPVAVIEEAQGAPWTGLRFSLLVSDNDGIGDLTVLSWRPSRLDKNGVHGSGSFVREVEVVEVLDVIRP